MQFIGLNLTVPHKLLALDMVDVLDESAKRWGAVNTMRLRRARRLRGIGVRCASSRKLPREIRSHGFNTDADAITRALREDLGLELTARRCCCWAPAGQGGPLRSKLAAERVRRTVPGQPHPQQGGGRREEIRQRLPGREGDAGLPAGTVDLVLNATSAGPEGRGSAAVRPERSSRSSRPARCMT